MQTPKSQQDHSSGKHISRAAASTVSGTNGLASFQAPAQPAVAPEQPAQMKKCEVNDANPKTTVEWVEDKLQGSNEPVGVYMEANNLHKGNVGGGDLVGTPPKAAAQKDLMAQLPTQPSLKSTDKYIKGHLLNHNIGGPGLDFNMFPITGSANKAHHTFVEKDVKAWVNAQKVVNYKVKVDSINDESKNGNKKGKVNAVFRCYAENLTDKKEISQDIPSTFNVKEEPRDNDKNSSMTEKDDNDVDMQDVSDNESDVQSNNSDVDNKMVDANDPDDQHHFGDGSWLALVYVAVKDKTDNDKVETQLDVEAEDFLSVFKKHLQDNTQNSKILLQEMFGGAAKNLTDKREEKAVQIVKEILFAFIINNDDNEQAEYTHNYPNLMKVLNTKKN